MAPLKQVKQTGPPRHAKPFVVCSNFPKGKKSYKNSDGSPYAQEVNTVDKTQR